MCDKEVLNLPEILQSLATRRSKILLRRAEEIFPALKQSMVSDLCVKELYQPVL
jgi:hypothetical protein